MKDARDLFGIEAAKAGFVIGTGPSIELAHKRLSVPHSHTFRIAINRAIERIPAEYWLWIDGDAYLASKDHENAKSAIRLGVEHFSDLYDEETYVWERCLGNIEQDLAQGKLVHRATSLIAAISMAMRLGAYRIVTVGCDNAVSDAHVEARAKADPSKNWRSIYNFTFARINEALARRERWLPREVMLADASHVGSEWGKLNLKKTSLIWELQMVAKFHEYLEKERTGNGG